MQHLRLTATLLGLLLPVLICRAQNQVVDRCVAPAPIDTSQVKKRSSDPIPDNNDLHQLHALASTAADQGQYQKALKIAAQIAEIKVPTARGNAVSDPAVYYLSSTITALIYMRAGQYDVAAASLVTSSVSATSGARHSILFLRSYCRLRHAITHPEEAHSSKIIRREKFALNRHLKALQQAEPSPPSQVWAQYVAAYEILLSEARAWVDNATPNQPYKKTWANIAIRNQIRTSNATPPLLITPVEESLGWLALHVGDTDQAKKYFGASLKNRRMSGYAYLGIARCYRREKNTAKAVEFYKKSLTSFTHADRRLPECIEARNFIAEHRKTPPSP
ncbi:MAG: tetratricopeptide repeat protein [Verrucomicrobiae bacterium]|nr:tetratricopeptide repeat protein [Verrucomicrobiae bacterium]NNJ43487.1 tetratricopeptide repeat protein [Akkermansiaceae bacterium]